MNHLNTPKGFNPESIIPAPVPERIWPTMSLALDLSGRCNMACRYCIESQELPFRQSMTPETLEAAWKMIIPDGVPKKGMIIRMGSGEPLLNFPLMKKIMELQRALNVPFKDGKPPIPVSITTNGSLLTDEITQWLVDSGWEVKISFDGPEFIHDKWRVLPGGGGTYANISKRVEYLAKHIPNRFSVNAVLCHGTDPADVFHGIAKLGLKRIEMVPVVHRDENIMPGLEDVENYRNFVKSHAKRIIESDGSKFIPSLTRFDECVMRMMGYNLNRITCGSGRIFYGAGPEGNLYPCFRFIGIEKYNLGNVHTGINEEAVLAFQRAGGRTYENRKPCNECWAAPLCSGPCFAIAEMFGPGDGAPVPIHCQYVLANAEIAVELVNELREKDPEKLISFLPSNLDEIMDMVAARD